jgi:hypothetical protein
MEFSGHFQLQSETFSADKDRDTCGHGNYHHHFDGKTRVRIAISAREVASKYKILRSEATRAHSIRP